MEEIIRIETNKSIDNLKFVTIPLFIKLYPLKKINFFLGGTYNFYQNGFNKLDKNAEKVEIIDGIVHNDNKQIEESMIFLMIDLIALSDPFFAFVKGVIVCLKLLDNILTKQSIVNYSPVRHFVYILIEQLNSFGCFFNL